MRCALFGDALRARPVWLGTTAKARARIHEGVRFPTAALGLFRHTRAEVADYLRLAVDEGLSVVFSVGPRATYDTSASRLTQHGNFLGHRLRGVDQLRRAFDDAPDRRSADGCARES